jgi:hypothetical protein
MMIEKKDKVDESLHKEAERLMNEGKVEEAVEKFYEVGLGSRVGDYIRLAYVKSKTFIFLKIELNISN